ncbi:MAG: tetratricopeptide repeat-containing sensor histidine kinase [Cyclobacteriaceae bacterium]
MSARILTLTTILLFLFGKAQAFPQGGLSLDSLVVAVEKLPRGDSSRLNTLAWIAQNQTDPKLRLKYSEILMEEAREVSDLKHLHHAYLQQGQAYRLMGDFEIAIYALFKALDYAEQVEFKNGVAGANTALADVYSLIGDNANALDYYNKSIASLRESNNDSSLLANTLLNLGDEYYEAKMYDSALSCFRKSKAIYEVLRNSRDGLAYNLGNMGLVFAEIGESTKAEQNIRASLIILEDLKDHYGRAIFLSYLSEIYKRKNQLKEAKNLIDSSMSIARTYDLKTEIRDNNLRLADIYAMNADYETAYKFHQQYVALKDSIDEGGIYAKIENLKSAFDLAKKQSEVDLLIADKKNKEIILIFTIIIAVILTFLAIVSYGYYRSKERVNRILEEQKASLESLNKTKDKYFSIISHDLRGSVSSFYGISRMIKYLVGSKNPEQLLEVADDIDQSVERLSTLLDNLLNWAMQQQGQIPIVPEKLNVKEMVSEIVDTLSNLARGKGIAVETNIEFGIFALADKNTTMTILRNLLSNALKFTQEGGRIVLSGRTISGQTVIEVADNGVGISKEKLDKLFSSFETKSTYGTSGERGLGLGLQLIQEFAGLNNGAIQVRSEVGEGTIFTLNLPKA